MTTTDEEKRIKREELKRKLQEKSGDTKFCKHCGEIIPKDAVVCVHCGRQVEDVGSSGNGQPIVINNSASSSSSATAQTVTLRRRKHHSVLFDVIMCFCTGGLWLIWMIFRPKYE